MKRFLFIITAVTIILSYSSMTCAYSDKLYSIDIPDGYEEVSENNFISTEDGSGIGVIISDYDKSTGYIYTDKVIDQLAEETAHQIEKKIENEKDTIKNELKSQYGDSIDENKIDEFINSYEFKGIYIKELSTFTDNDYKCIHMAFKSDIGDNTLTQHTYITVSGNKTYTVTLTIPNSDGSSDVLDILDTFTINNYKELTYFDTMNSNIILLSVVPVIVVILIVLCIVAVKKKNKIS